MHEKSWLGQNEKTIDTLIFDLDGTLYQDLTFYKTYLHFLLAGTTLHSWEAVLVAFAESVFHGEKLQMNHFYRSHLLPTMSPDEYFQALENTLADSEEEAIYLGDAWAVLSLLGETLGLLENGRGEEVFRKTRAAMPLGEPDIHLQKALIEANTCFQTVLLSNSYETTASNFLSRLGLDGLFQHVIYDAKKPKQLIEHVEHVLPGFLRRPQSVMTIGDHAWNDLEPLRQKGCLTVWMNPYPNIAEPTYDIKLQSTSELASFLIGLADENRDIESISRLSRGLSAATHQHKNH